MTVPPFDGTIPTMALRKKKKQQQEEAAPAPVAQQAPVQHSGGYVRSELTTFDGKGNPSVIVYSTDSVGRTVKTRRGGRGRSH